MYNKWFTSDFHFDHFNIIKYCSQTRGQFNNVQEMNDAIIESFNSYVKKNDEVYFLGDFCFDHRKISYFSKKLNGKFVFIAGNHDKINKSYEYFYKIDKYFEINISKQKIVMCHYPFASWNGVRKGSIHLHGHTHGNLYPIGKRLDVGIDTHNLCPYSYEEIIDIMKNRDVADEEIIMTVNNFEEIDQLTKRSNKYLEENNF